jgi:hypothetical protein
MTALTATPAAAALANVHSEPTTNPLGLGQLVLILELDPLLHDLPTALAPIHKRRIELLIDLHRRLTMTMPPVLLARTTTRPTRTPGRLPARERRRLTLGRTPRLLQVALQLHDPRPQPLVLPRKPCSLIPQQLVPNRRLRAPRHQTRQLIRRLSRQHLDI